MDADKLAQILTNDPQFQSRSLHGIAFMLILAQSTPQKPIRSGTYGFSERSCYLIDRFVPMCPVLEEAVIELADAAFADGLNGDGFRKSTKNRLNRITELEPTMVDALIAIMTSTYADGVEETEW